VAVTVLLALGLVRWLAPELLGHVPADLRIVRTSREVPPFFEGVFRARTESGPHLINDPHSVVRMSPLNRPGRWGPTDLLGFRNRDVPRRADVVALGDSQTFGVNARMERNWPHVLERRLTPLDARVYALANGGWGAVQYMDLFRKSLAFAPAVAVVAFYAGNDAWESFHVAYAIERWEDLRVDPSLDIDDRPARDARTDPEQRWSIEFADGTPTVFTPGMRLFSSQDHPAIDAGWEIMAEVARRIAREGRAAGVRAVFTVIPTKELAYRHRVEAEGIALDRGYALLVQAERARIDALAREISALEGARYVDVVTPLQAAVLQGLYTHPLDEDGHPLPLGYALIAETLAPVVAEGLRAREAR